MTSPVLDPGPPPPPPPGPTPPAAGAGSARGAGDRFFTWTSGLGVVRGDGWVGGVAAGLAARLRIDPLIVRGVLVVAALFGLPALFLYALAWAVLPDLDERIPLQDAFRGRFTPAQIGIAAFALLGLIPFGPAVPFLFGAPSWAIEPGFGGWPLLSAVAVALAVLVVGGLTFLIVRAARSAPLTSDPGATQPGQRTASADPASPVPSAAASGSGPDAALADPVGVDAAGFAASAPASDSDPTGSDDAYAAWREQHAAWKMQDDAWRREQQDAARAARDQARRERHAHAATFSAEAAERRRIRRLTSPRTPFAYVATILGIAVSAGALIAVTNGTLLSGALGLFVAALVVALGMVIAGVVRRRSGFLASVTLVLLLGGLAATAAPAADALHLGAYGISNAPGSERWPSNDPFIQPWGDLDVYLADTGANNVMAVEKEGGTTRITLEPGVQLSLVVTTRDAAVDVVRDLGEAREYRGLGDVTAVTTTSLPDGRIRYSATLGGSAEEASTQQRLEIDQTSGYIEVSTLEAKDGSE